MSSEFRELLKKVGSGTHTSESLSRTEAAHAMRMMLLQEATPAQIGAFLMAHRIKRPTGEELAGFLDTYTQWGPQLNPIEGFALDDPLVLGSPYDGRTRTAPISPLTALILTTVGVPTILHGGGVMATKYGLPLVQVWQGLGVDWTKRSLAQVQQVFAETGLGFVYPPDHFPLTNALVSYRDQLGKRPPLATMELIWCPYAGKAKIIAGYVHPPTEKMFQTALALRGVEQLITVKGLEGSCDLPRDRTAIIGVENAQGFERLLLHPQEYGLTNTNVPLTSASDFIAQMQAVLQGEPGEMTQSALWNGGFYLWQAGICPDLTAGLAEAEVLLTQGRVRTQLQHLIQVLGRVSGA